MSIAPITFCARLVRRLTPRLRQARPYIQTTALIALVAFLALKLHDIGWRETWRAMPSDPDFYLVLLVSYAVLPVSDAVIYRHLWGLDLRMLPLFFRKRVYNEVLLDYSGEAYFWARARHRMPEGGQRRALLSVVRDVNLISGLISNTATLALLAVVLHLDVPGLPDVPRWAIAAVAALPIGVMLAILFARFFSLTRREAAAVGGLQTLRLVTVLGLQALLWSIALPDVPFERWLVVMAAQLVVTRLPFLPNRDLVMGGVVLTLAGIIAVPEAQIASTFMAIAALTLILHGLVLGVTSERLMPLDPHPTPIKEA